MKSDFEKALPKFDELICVYYSEDDTVEDNEEKRKIGICGI